MKNGKIFFVAGFFFLKCYSSFSQTATYGAIPSRQSDYSSIGTGYAPVVGSEPSAVDLSDKLPPVQNQGAQNSCVAFALAYACRSYQEKINLNYSYYDSNNYLDYSKVFSPSYLYHSINRNQDNGCDYFTAVEFLKNNGVCKWSTMPYNAQDYFSAPNVTQATEASNFKIDTYRRFENDANLLNNIKSALIDGNPVVIAVRVDKNYFDYGFNNNPTYTYLWNSFSGTSINMTHALTIVGYDNNLQAFKFLNSYGTNWGNDGFGWMSYNIVNSVITEAYIIKAKTTTTNVSNQEIFNTQNQLTQNDINQYNLNFQVLNTQFMNPSPDPNTWSMQIMGDVTLPKGIGSNAQIVVYLYYNNNGVPGYPVMSTNYAFSLLNGQAAAETQDTWLNQNQNFYSNWSLIVPNSALSLPYGTWQQTPFGPQYLPYTSYLMAQPVLFVDHFPMRVGNPIPFQVTK